MNSNSNTTSVSQIRRIASVDVLLNSAHLLYPEHGDNRVRAAALKKTIQLVLNGERLPGLLMTIIRFVMPSNDHTLKKLLLIFWEIWPKTSADGKLLHEMILVCDAYRKVRGQHVYTLLEPYHTIDTCI